MMDCAICPTCSSFVEQKGEGYRPYNEATSLCIGLEALLVIADSKRRTDSEKVKDMKDLAERVYRDLTDQRLIWHGSALVETDRVMAEEGGE